MNFNLKFEEQNSSFNLKWGEVIGNAKEPVIKPLTVTENGEYSAGEDIDGFSPVNVNVPLRYEEGYNDGYNEGYNASQDGITLQEKTATENGEVVTDDGFTGMSKVTVAVPIKEEQEKTVEITANGTTEVVADEGKSMSKVTVNTNVVGGSVDSGVLPIGYTPVPSIKFTGEQAVDTGIICNQNTQIRVLFTAEADKGMYIYGVANGDNTASVTAYRSSTGGRWRFGNQNIVLMTVPDEKIVWSVQVNSTHIIRGNVESSFSKVGDFTTEGTLILGGGRLADGNIETSTRLVGKIITFMLYDGDELVRSFIPCKNTEGVCGFWDIVSEQFFTTVSDTPLEWSFI